MVANNVVNEKCSNNTPRYEQFNLFADYSKQDNKIKQQEKDEEEEKKLQNVLLDIKNKYGKNSILKGMNLIEGGTTIERNGQIGGHKG